MVKIAFNILTRHLELILSTNQGNGHEYVQVYVFPVFFFYFILFLLLCLFFECLRRERDKKR